MTSHFLDVLCQNLGIFDCFLLFLISISAFVLLAQVSTYIYLSTGEISEDLELSSYFICFSESGPNATQCIGHARNSD